MTFQELAKLGMELLAKQPPLTYEQMREQALHVEQETKSRRGKKITKR